MKSTIKYLILVIVVLAIVAIFIMTLRRYQSIELLCVNLALVVANSTLLFCRIFNTKRRDAINKTLTEAQVKGRRVRWISSFLYAIFSLITVARSLLHSWSFKETVGIQLILIIGLILCYITSLGVTRSAQRKREALERAQGIISALKQKIQAIEHSLKAQGLVQYNEIVGEIKSRVDSFEVTNNPHSNQIDKQIGEKLGIITALISEQSVLDSILKFELEALDNLTSIR